MNNLLKFIIRFHDFILFFILEGIALGLIVNSTFYQQTQLYSGLQTVQNYCFVTFSRITEYTSLKADNEQLADENVRLRNQLDYYLQQDTLQPRQVTDEREGYLYTYYPAKLANITTHKQRNYMVLNVGEWKNVHPDMGVVANNSVVGIVVNSSARFATVMSLLNRDCKISARLKRTGHLGSLTWDGVNYREVVLTEVPQHVRIQVGDTVETSGYSALFPEGLLIGTVISSETQKGSFHDIRVRLAIDFKTLRYVEVVNVMLQSEQRFIEQEYQIK